MCKLFNFQVNDPIVQNWWALCSKLMQTAEPVLTWTVMIVYSSYSIGMTKVWVIYEALEAFKLKKYFCIYKLKVSRFCVWNCFLSFCPFESYLPTSFFRPSLFHRQYKISIKWLKNVYFAISQKIVYCNFPHFIIFDQMGSLFAAALANHTLRGEKSGTYIYICTYKCRHTNI